MSPRRSLLLLIALNALLVFHQLDGTDLWTSHEARAAQNAQRMLDDGDWQLPTLFDGQVELQKPPGFYWLVAGIGELRGRVDRWAVRLPSAVAALATVLMIWGYLVQQGRPRAGLLAGLALTTAVHFTSSARIGRIDMSLTAVTTGALLLLQQYGKGRTLGAGLLLGAGILLKGPIALALPMCVLTTQSVIHRRRGQVASGFIAGLIGVATAAPAYLWVNHATGGEFFRVFIGYHNIDRALGDAPALATYPWWYYIPRLSIDLLPWTPVLVSCLYLFARRPLYRDDPAASLGLVWLGAMLGLLSLAQFKRADYLLPAYPAAALFIGCVGERWFRARAERISSLQGEEVLTTKITKHTRGIPADLGVFRVFRGYPALIDGHSAATSADMSIADLNVAQARTETSQQLFTLLLSLVIVGTVAGWALFRLSIEPAQEASREQQAFAAHVRAQCPAPREVLLYRVESHLLAYHLGRPIRTLIEWHDLNRWLQEPGEHWFITRAEFVPECLQYVHTRRIEVWSRSEQFTRGKPARPLVLMRTVDN